MKIMMTLTLTETEARKLWERCAEEDGEPPIGADLAYWMEDFCQTTIESNFQFDAGVYPSILTNSETDTVHLLQQLEICDNTIGTGDDDTPDIRQAKERHQEILEQLVASDDPERADQELRILRAAYAPTLQARKFPFPHTSSADESAGR
ncbi:hypothetical protein [Hyphomicrobium sp. DY-1]|uniref:hypothetical protein n=1 Tax=Hyphomicrobium sp. DY-1 TaxID=3075650 RepID=UPI0039C0F014